jgi:CzcA family heavy metal efflux pump
MLAIVRIALRRPYTFVVMAMLIAIFGVLAWIRTPTDIFPNIGIPVVSVVWSYRGLDPDDMSGRVIYYYERTLTTQVSDIQHIESQSVRGIGVVKIFFQPNVNINGALAQVTAASQTVIELLPPGITPPYVLSFNASSVPILQLALASNTISQAKLFDLGQNFIRPQLATVAGAAIPSPYGGKVREVQVDIDQHALQAHGLSANDVVNAISVQNLILPGGSEKIGKFEYAVDLNASPTMIESLNDLPIKTADGGVVYIRDVAHVYDGSRPQDNLVRVDGRHAVLMTIQKAGNASTLDIISQVKALLPRIKAALPAGLELHAVGDQSLFVNAAVTGVMREGAIAAALTGLMILLFLGSWRSTLIITLSIPLAVLSSIAMLSVLGQTINVMTLGGLALAVGILVDDATVTIENINWHLEQGKEIEPAIMDGARQIVVPAFVSLLCICIVFVPMFSLGGVAGYLFVPMAEAVVFAMMASFVLSRTLVPTMANYLLSAQPHHAGGRSRNPLLRFQRGFEQRFNGLRVNYNGLLVAAVARRWRFVAVFLLVVLCSFAIAPWLGQDFFPSVDGGQIKLHIRAQAGTRIEETARLCDHIEAAIRRIIPPADLDSIVDNIGLPVSGINQAFSNSAPIGPEDADIQISLKPNHRPTAGYQEKLRTSLPRQFPGTLFAFQPADIITQILNFGLPAPIDVQVSGPDMQADRRFADKLLRRIALVPGIADPHIQQTFNQPTLDVDVDRSMAAEQGLTERDIAESLGVSLAGSGQTNPSFWLNPKNGVSYPIVTQMPQYDIDSVGTLRNIPVTAHGTSALLGGLATVRHVATDGIVTHYDVQPAIDIFASVHRRDLGGVAADIRSILAAEASSLPPGAVVAIHGQVSTMTAAFGQLYFGLAAAIVLIYLLIVVNFQSWLDPFVIITGLPAALAGIVWMLFLTHTTLSVPALTGAIMCMGVATANSILVVSFAREKLTEGADAVTAAIEAGTTRFRPVLMTALAMIIGMAPMALGMGEGGEQNAPLGRAVIGGLVCATCATLFFVPVVFSIAHSPRRRASQTTALVQKAPSHV